MGSGHSNFYTFCHFYPAASARRTNSRLKQIAILNYSVRLGETYR